MNLCINIISRDGTYNPYLRAWLLRHDLPHSVIRSPYGLVTGRNGAAEDFLAGDGSDLLMLDRCMAPDEDAEAILTAPGDLVYCGAVAHGCSHFGNGDFGIACGRMSRQLLEKIDAPWFQFMLNATGTKVVACECQHLLARARDTGYKPRMVGRCRHLVQMMVKPDEEGKAQFQWPG